MITPILMLGAGRMGGAILEGWRRVGVFPAGEVMVVDPQPGEAALAAEQGGARLNPPDADLALALAVVREAAARAIGLRAYDAQILGALAALRTGRHGAQAAEVEGACG